MTDSGDPDEIRSTLDPESKITLGNLSPVHLSPNPFFGINLDQMGLDGDTISMEWTNYNPSAFVAQSTSPSHSGGVYAIHHNNNQQQQQQHQQQMQLPIVCLSSGDVHQHHNNHSHSHLLSDSGSGNGGLANGCDITFINVDQLHMEQLKTECILNDELPCQTIDTRAFQSHSHSHLDPLSQLQTNSGELDGEDTPTNHQAMSKYVVDGLGQDDDYQSIRVDHQQHQHLQTQQTAAYQYHHCPTMLDFNHFGWITDRSATPPPMHVPAEQGHGGSESVSNEEETGLDKELTHQY